MLVLNREDFPTLLAAVLDRNWPPLVQDERCRMSASIGEDYAGASCTGNLVQAPSLPVTYTGTGDDYPGPFASTQLGNKLTIFVHLQLTGEEHQLSAKANQ